jgi:hypothetical protein
MRPLRFLQHILLAVLLCISVVRPARSQVTDDVKQQIADLKKQGNAAMDNNLYADALGYYTAAYKLDPSDVALLYNRGRALAGMGSYPDALDAFSDFQAKASPELRGQVGGLEQFMTDLRKKVATIEVRCNVGEAEIRVRDDKDKDGDRSYGHVSDKRVLRVNAGTKTITISAENYFPWTKTLELQGGSSSIVEAALASKKTSAKLIVQSSTVGALVTVDGQQVGNVPLELSIVPGFHQIQLQKDGFDPVQSSANVDAGEEKHIDLTMTQKSGIIGKWWFWTAVGAVVVGGVITTYALLTPRDYDTGTIPPGRVSTAAIHF